MLIFLFEKKLFCIIDYCYYHLKTSEKLIKTIQQRVLKVNNSIHIHTVKL